MSEASEVHVLVVDDNDDDAVLVVRELTRSGLPVSYVRADTPDGVAAALAGRPPDVVICDYNMPAFRAEDALRRVCEFDPDIPFLLVSGQVGEETAAAMMRAGARDFVLKDRLARLAPAVQRELQEAAERRHRHRAEAALRESEERFRLLAEHAQDIIFRCRLEPEMAVEYVSPAVETVTGYRPEQFYTDPGLLLRLVEPEDRPVLDQAWRSPSPGTVTIRWRRPGGGLAWMEQRAGAILDGADRPVAVEGIMRDITERTRLEQQLRQAERLDSLGRLAGGIAHDFNNILAVISGYATMLGEELAEGDPSRADARAIEEAAARGSGLTRQLLIFSRLEPSRPETLDLNMVAADMQRLLSRTLGEDIELRTDLGTGLPPITMDRSKLEQVLMNAVMNSRAAMPAGGRLTIATSADPDGAHVCLSIADTGSGMTPEVAGRAFEPFFTTKGRGNGTGLGLATAYGVVADVGGTITLESQPGEGTVVRVRLPAGDVVDAPPERTERATRAPGGSSRRILVVEDEDGVRDIVSRILTKAGYEVSAAADPQEALKACLDSSMHVDVLLSDVIMPGMSGTQLAAELRRSRPDLPVLFMSGYTSGPNPGGQELPADAPLLHKPFQADHLLTAVYQLLDRPES
jgi:PAS domain S-box-containing protein